MLLVDASQVAAGSETVQLSSAEHASVQMNDAPDTAGHNDKSWSNLWQMNKVGLEGRKISVLRNCTLLPLR